MVNGVFSFFEEEKKWKRGYNPRFILIERNIKYFIRFGLDLDFIKMKSESSKNIYYY